MFRFKVAGFVFRFMTEKKRGCRTAHAGWASRFVRLGRSGRRELLQTQTPGPTPISKSPAIDGLHLILTLPSYLWLAVFCNFLFALSHISRSTCLAYFRALYPLLTPDHRVTGSSSLTRVVSTLVMSTQRLRSSSSPSTSLSTPPTRRLPPLS